MKNLIIYESKYGTTKESAEIFSKVIGYSKIIKTNEFVEKYKQFDNYIFLSPIYNEKITENISNFINNNSKWLSKKYIYFCIVNLSGRPEVYLEHVNNILKDSLIFMKAINGNLIIEKLNKEDYEAIKKFTSITNIPFTDMKKFSINEVIDIALQIKDNIDDRREKLSDEIVGKVVDKFIQTHNTCVISTCYDNYPRATPIEYTYYKNKLYFISEGGVKFANIIRNKNISIGIFDNYKTMSKLGGLQITGKVKEITYLSNEYFEVMKMKKISKETIEKLELILNIFEVSMEKIEVLNTEFKKYKGDSKQILK